MPMYEFKCVYCNNEFEELVKVDTELCDCPKCGWTSVKQVSQSTFILKGSGWYADLYSSTKTKGGE